jgi:hypothetical protein
VDAIQSAKMDGGGFIQLRRQRQGGTYAATR